MAASRNYSRAPITEAIIEIQFRASPDWSVARLSEWKPSGQYPSRSKIQMGTGVLQFGERMTTSTSAHDVGFRFATVDEKQIIQACVDRFGFSRLAPYQSWEPFRNEARQQCSSYLEMVRPHEVTRLAVRYINRLDVPNPVLELKDFLRTGPEIAPELPQTMAGFFFQVNIPQEDIKGTLILNETIVPPPHPNVTSLVLDIDLFRTTDIPGDEAGLWDVFEVLHDRKNHIFEACITDKTRELIE